MILMKVMSPHYLCRDCRHVNGFKKERELVVLMKIEGASNCPATTYYD